MDVLPLRGQPRFLVVRVLMLLHVILSDKSLTASITFKWPPTGMDAGMSFEVGLVGEHLRASVALMSPCTGMHLNMFFVHFFVRKSLAALGAFERLVARMEAFVMLREIATSHEIFVTINTLIDAILRNKIGYSGSDLTLLARVGLALTLFLRLQADVRV